MASLPPSHRRDSGRPRSSSDRNAQPLQSSSQTSEVSSAASEDSQTVLLSPKIRQEDKTEASQASSNKTAGEDNQKELRRCWICFEDETDDTPISSDWRSPCPCALTAHEACLLDWIADMEAPNSRRPRAGQQHKIECPQCKSEIVVARPRSWVVDGVRAIEDACHRAILPSMLLMSATSIYRLFFEYGLLAVEAVFGPDDAARLLAPLFFIPSGKSWESLAKYFRSSLRLNIGLPLVPPVLILSRTSLGDGILPIFPMLFLATAPAQDSLSDLADWPPSAGFSFALLPFARAAYNMYYERVWGEKERRWLREVQPRSATATTEEGNNHGGDVEEVLDDGDNIIEINIDLLEEIPEPAPADANDREHGAPQAQAENGQAAGADQEAGADGQAAVEQAAAPAEQRGALNLNLTTTRLADTVLGALAFPFISSAMGDVLRLALPKAWTTASWRKPTGFLQSRWARSLVGGCLFVVLKDAVMLYVRWKMAQNHRKRRILNYDKVKKRVVRN